MKALQFWMYCILLFVFLQCLTYTHGWKRSALIYNQEGRDIEAWKRHVMRITNRGSYTPQWLFDSAILTTEKINGKDIYHGMIEWTSNYLNGQDLQDLIDMLVRDASDMDQAISSLTSQFGEDRQPPSKLQIFIGFPYLNPTNRKLNIEGNVYDLANEDRRVSAAKWFLDNLLKALRTREWKYFNFGIYYHREDVLIQHNDAAYIKRVNEYVHDLGMSSVWVPYYDAPVWAFNGTGLGFDHTVIQSRYPYRSSIDAGILKGDRLYSTGYKAAAQSQCMEYELRSHGESEEEYHMAHQLLAISQATGASQFEQVLYTGKHDIFDRVTSQASAPGKVWDAYNDLTNYLGGAGIWDLEVDIGYGAFQDVNANRKELKYVISGSWLENLNSIRMDFNDTSEASPWRGGMAVLVQGDQTRSSFAYRLGTDDINPTYNSIFVPLSNFPTPQGTSLTIQLFREDNSPWPNIIRLVGAKLEPLFIANPAFSAVSTSSSPVHTAVYQDSAPTHTGYANGKLTDGVNSSQWWHDNSVGWYQIEKRITITIDLGSVKQISSVKIHAWNHYNSGISWPRRVGVLAGVDCEPQERGMLNGCVPSASSGRVMVSTDKGSCGPFCDKVILTGNFGPKTSVRYITVSMVSVAWLMLDEVQVLDGRNEVISNGMNYRLAPAPGQYSGWGKDFYTSDGQNLADGAIFKDFVYGRNVVVLPGDEDGTVELTWIKPLEKFMWAVIWITDSRSIDWVRLPPSVNIQWRDGNGVWQAGQTVSVSGTNSGGVCTASACAALRLPGGARVTGVRGTVPKTDHWTMVSEISLM